MSARKYVPRSSSRKTTRKSREPLGQTEAILASFPQSIISCDQEGKILWMNAAALELFEVPSQARWRGISYQLFLQQYEVHDEQEPVSASEQWFLNMITNTERTPASPESSLRLFLPSGRTIYLDHWHSCLRDKEETIHVFQDMTYYYQKTIHLQRVHKALLALTEASMQIPEQLDPLLSETFSLLSPAVLTIAQPLVDVIWYVLGCLRVFLLAYRPEGQYYYIAGKGLNIRQEQLQRERGWEHLSLEYVSEETLARLAANQEVVVPVRRLRKAIPFSEGMGAENILLIPLFLEQKRVGSLSIVKKGSEQGYTSGEIEFVRTVAGQMMLVIECVRYLQQKNQTLTQSLILQEINHLSNDFLTLASHELRTPLTGIKGNLQLAQRRLERMKHQIDEQSITQVEQSLASASRSMRLQERNLQNLIDDACIQANQLALYLHPCDLLALVRKVVVKQQQLTPERTIILEVRAQEQEISVLADAERITQVLNTYLTNALYTSSTELPVTVMVTVEEAVARVAVHDEGPGIPAEEQTHLWDRFYRAKGTAVQHELDLSFGLGLYLCQVFIARHHGSVGVESTPGKGATFWFTLPIASSVDE